MAEALPALEAQRKRDLEDWIDDNGIDFSTFARKHGQDIDLLRYAYDFEQQTRRRRSPPVTPALESDEISLQSDLQFRNSTSGAVLLDASSAARVSENEIKVSGQVQASSAVTLEVTTDGKVVPSQDVEVQGDSWTMQAEFARFEAPKATYGGIGRVADRVMVTVLAKSAREVSGKLLLMPQKGAVHQEVERRKRIR